LGFQKEGHITDRISKAVEMLGAEKTVKLRGNDEDDNDITIEETRPNIEVRIGGILSLERIAQDSCAYDKGRDHVRVMEILCAYVRENSRANSLASTPTPFVPKKPRLDIQKAVDGIKRRSAAQLQIETVAEYRLDLRETDLDGCDLSKGSFVGAIFWRSRLESTNFTKTDLTAARFQGCLLNFTLFEETLLRGTNLDFAILSETGFGYFARAKLDSLFVEGAQMQGLHINEANCRKIFGSSDTTVASSLESDKVFGLHAANMTYLSETTDNEASIEDHHGVVSEKAKYFLHWNPYTAYDMASEHFRRKFREERGLVGWPFQD